MNVADNAWLEEMAIAAVYLGELAVSDCQDGWFTDGRVRQAWQQAVDQANRGQRPFVGDVILQDPALGTGVMDWMAEYNNSVAPLPRDGGGLVRALNANMQRRALRLLTRDWGILDPNEARQRLFQAVSDKTRDRWLDVSINDAVTDFYNAATDPSQQPAIIRTGYYALDRVLLGGFQAGDVILIGARTSTGKSAVALNFARNMVRQDQKRVLFISLEMSRRDVVTRLLAPSIGRDTRILRVGDFTGDRTRIAGQLAQAIGPISAWPLRIWDRPGLTLADIDHRVQQLQDSEGIDCVMIDYVQLLHRPRQQNTAEELSAIAEELKVLAKRWAIPVVTMAQINRTAEQTQDAEPQVWHLKGSGGLEESADVILLLHRPINGRLADGSGPMRIRIAKQRNGPTDTVDLWFDAPRQELRESEGLAHAQ